MIIVVDANILFSAVITPNGKIAEILGHSSLGAKRISAIFLFRNYINMFQKSYAVLKGQKKL
jgi:predicted nucleic acid-binding protein